MNKKIALERLCEIIANKNVENELLTEHYNWLEKKSLERGNAVLVFKGLAFIKK